MATEAEKQEQPVEEPQAAQPEPAPEPVVEEVVPEPVAKEAPEAKPEKPAPKPKAAPKATAPGLLLFNKWDVSGISCTDAGLKNYITLTPRIVPKTGARYAGNRFHKSKVFIVERLMNKMMVAGHKGKDHYISSGHNTGKAAKIYATVKRAFEIIEQRMKMNPVAVFVQAIENAAPREEIINIEYGGARYPQPVECAPQRRVDIVLRMMAQGCYHKAFNKKKLAAETLADEIINAYKLSNQSQAIQKKIDLERTADSSR